MDYQKQPAHPAVAPHQSFLRVLFVAALLCATSATGAEPTHPPRLPRADSYFGLHFDFHAGPDCTEIGKNTTREMIENVLRETRPDYVQIDCKGHPGLSSYPTRAGNPAPGFVGDPLKVWREVTAEHGVALYMHYSGVWDSEAIRRHPDWAVINADGTTNQNATSFYSPYADDLLIPQLRELAGVYGVDGAWVDGECWASQPDYGAAALRAFQAATGYDSAPRGPGEPHWFEFLEFNREAFRIYLRYYLSEVKKTNPALQLCSNWAFSDHMPEPVSAPVDWISGDYTPEDSVNSARLSARYLVHQGKPWDLMAWSFVNRGELINGSRQKPAVQLQREAAVVLAQGGGFQFYCTQRRDGSIREEYLPQMAEVARFCRERQPFCQGAMPVPQIALVYSTASHYREINGLFGRDLSRIQGTLQALLESQQVVDVVSESHLRQRMFDYPLIVVAECDYLEPSFKQDLLGYARHGGKVLLIGPQVASLFSAELDVSLAIPQEEPFFLRTAGTMLPTRDQVRVVTLGGGAIALGELVVADDPSSPSHPAASITSVGRGQIAATFFSFSRGYLANRSAESRAFLNDLVKRLFPDPLVQVTGTSNVDVSVNRLDDQLAINLVNTSGAHWDREKPLFDSIPTVGPLEIAFRVPQRPTRVTLQPGSRELGCEYRDGRARVTVPRLDIHALIVIE